MLCKSGENSPRLKVTFLCHPLRKSHKNPNRFTSITRSCWGVGSTHEDDYRLKPNFGLFTELKIHFCYLHWWLFGNVNCWKCRRNQTFSVCLQDACKIMSPWRQNNSSSPVSNTHDVHLMISKATQGVTQIETNVLVPTVIWTLCYINTKTANLVESDMVESC